MTETLLDTHILLWWHSTPGKLPRRYQAILRGEAPVFVAAITLWEIATLVELGRVRLGLPLREWLEAAVAQPKVSVIDLTPAIADRVAALPTHFHRDPADRIIVATAQVMGMTLLTADKMIIDANVVRTR